MNPFAQIGMIFKKLDRDLTLRILKCQAVGTFYTTRAALGLNYSLPLDGVRPYRLQIIKVLPGEKPKKEKGKKSSVYDIDDIASAVNVYAKLRASSTTNVNLYYRAKFTDWKSAIYKCSIAALEGIVNSPVDSVICSYIDHILWNSTDYKNPQMSAIYLKELRRVMRALYHGYDFGASNNLKELKIKFLEKWAYDSRNIYASSSQDILVELQGEAFNNPPTTQVVNWHESAPNPAVPWQTQTVTLSAANSIPIWNPSPFAQVETPTEPEGF